MSISPILRATKVARSRFVRLLSVTLLLALPGFVQAQMAGPKIPLVPLGPLSAELKQVTPEQSQQMDKELDATGLSSAQFRAFPGWDLAKYKRFDGNVVFGLNTALSGEAEPLKERVKQMILAAHLDSADAEHSDAGIATLVYAYQPRDSAPMMEVFLVAFDRAKAAAAVKKEPKAAGPRAVLANAMWMVVRRAQLSTPLAMADRKLNISMSKVAEILGKTQLPDRAQLLTAPSSKSGPAPAAAKP